MELNIKNAAEVKDVLKTLKDDLDAVRTQLHELTAIADSIEISVQSDTADEQKAEESQNQLHSLLLEFLLQFEEYFLWHLQTAQHGHNSDIALQSDLRCSIKKIRNCMDK